MNEELYQKILQVDLQAAIFYEQICNDPDPRPGLFLSTTTPDLGMFCVWGVTPQGLDYWYEINRKIKALDK